MSEHEGLGKEKRAWCRWNSTLGKAEPMNATCSQQIPSALRKLTHVGHETNQQITLY